MPFSGPAIVFVWSQYHGANIEQRTIGKGWRQNQVAKLKIVGGDLVEFVFFTFGIGFVVDLYFPTLLVFEFLVAYIAALH